MSCLVGCKGFHLTSWLKPWTEKWDLITVLESFWVNWWKPDLRKRKRQHLPCAFSWSPPSRSQSLSNFLPTLSFQIWWRKQIWCGRYFLVLEGWCRGSGSSGKSSCPSPGSPRNWERPVRISRLGTDLESPGPATEPTDSPLPFSRRQHVLWDRILTVFPNLALNSWVQDILLPQPT